jgi:hypothetical protein
MLIETPRELLGKGLTKQGMFNGDLEVGEHEKGLRGRFL